MEQLITQKSDAIAKHHDDPHSPKHEDKTTLTFYIPEAERLIRSVNLHFFLRTHSFFFPSS